MYCSTCGVAYNNILVSDSPHSYVKCYLKIIIWKCYLMRVFESVWMCPYSECVCVRVCIIACYRTVVYSLSLCVIWCSWLSSNLIWEHLIPRCLFPLCLISVSHKQAKSKASTPSVISILFLSEITSHKNTELKAPQSKQNHHPFLAKCLCGRPFFSLLLNSWYCSWYAGLTPVRKVQNNNSVQTSSLLQLRVSHLGFWLPH